MATAANSFGCNVDSIKKSAPTILWGSLLEPNNIGFFKIALLVDTKSKSFKLGFGFCVGCLPKLSMMACAKTVVFTEAIDLSPKSPVCTPDSNVNNNAFSIMTAFSIMPR